jgi:hypothetical protein
MSLRYQKLCRWYFFRLKTAGANFSPAPATGLPTRALSVFFPQPSRAPAHGSGRCGSLFLHRSGLSPSTPCRYPGAYAILNGLLASDSFASGGVLILGPLLASLKDACAAFPDKRLFDGGYRSVGLFTVLHAVGVVSILSALARGGTQDLQLPDVVRHGENPDRESHPFSARSSASLASTILVRPSP